METDACTFQHPPEAEARFFIASGVVPPARCRRHYGMLTRLAAHEGLSQQALGGLIGLTPTRMVFLVDELEQRGLVQRRRNTADRRSYALYRTTQGQDTLRRYKPPEPATKTRSAPP